MDEDQGSAHSRKVAMEALAHVMEGVDHANSLLEDTDVEQVQRAHEITRECTEQVARSIWFLHRAARIGEEESVS